MKRPSPDTDADSTGSTNIPGSDVFDTTQWSLVVLAAHQSLPHSRDALAELCQAYWLPLYSYVRRRVADTNEAQDLTQEFFADVLERNALRLADPDRGRFRAFLLTAMKRFIVNQRQKQSALKRGGGRSALSLDFRQGEQWCHTEPAERLTAEQVYLRSWGRALLARVMQRLAREFETAGQSKRFGELRRLIAPNPDRNVAAVADALGMSPAAVRLASHRMRRRYRALLREEIGRTVARVDEVEDEIRDLFSAFES